MKSGARHRVAALDELKANKMLRPSYWSRIAAEFIASRNLHIVTERELHAELKRRGCVLYERGAAPPGERPWQTALSHSMRALGWKLYQPDSERVYKRRPPRPESPAPVAAPAPAPKLPEVFVVRRSRASMVEGGAQ